MKVDIGNTLAGLEVVLEDVGVSGMENRDAVVKLLTMAIADVKEIERQREDAVADYERMKAYWTHQSRVVNKTVGLATEIKALAGQILTIDVPF